MNQEEKLLALAISKLNELLQKEKVKRVQIDAEDVALFDGEHSLDIHVVFSPRQDEGVNDNE